MNDKLKNESLKIKKELESIYEEIFKKKNKLDEDFNIEEELVFTTDSINDIENSLSCELKFNIKNSVDAKLLFSKVKEYFSSYSNNNFNVLLTSRFFVENNDNKTYIINKDGNLSEDKTSCLNKKFPASVEFVVLKKSPYLIKSPFVFENGLMNFSGEEGHNKVYEKFKESHGFSPTETWDLTSSIAKFVLPRLIYLKENYHGLLFEDPTGRKSKKVLTVEETDKIFDKMIKSFKYAVFCNSNSDTEISTREYEEIHEGLRLFSKYFFNLWD